MELQAQKIKTYRQFVDLTNEFDNFYNTKTYISFLTLKEINNIFVNNNIHDHLNKLFNNLFADKCTVFSNEPWLNDSHIGKFNALSKIIDDIRAGVGITSPVSVSRFKNLNTAMHPGTTRLLLAELYNERIPVIITDFVGDFLEKFDNIQCTSANDSHVPNVIGMDFTIDSTALFDSPSTYRKAAPLNTVFKELTDHCDFYAKPTCANPPRKYELKSNKFYIDNTYYACYNNNSWRLIV